MEVGSTIYNRQGSIDRNLRGGGRVIEAILLNKDTPADRDSTTGRVIPASMQPSDLVHVMTKFSMPDRYEIGGNAVELSGTSPVFSNMDATKTYRFWQQNPKSDENTQRISEERKIFLSKIDEVPCKYCSGGECKKIDVRCGDRGQYSIAKIVGETKEQKSMPHICKYSETAASKVLFILDRNEKTYSQISLFKEEFGLSFNDLLVASDSLAALEKFNSTKLSDERIGFVVYDASKNDDSFFEFVFSLYDRNFAPKHLILNAKNSVVSEIISYFGKAVYFSDSSFEDQSAFFDAARKMFSDN